MRSNADEERWINGLGHGHMARIESPPPAVPAAARQQQQAASAAQGKRVRSVLFLAALAFVGMLVFDDDVDMLTWSTTIWDNVENEKRGLPRRQLTDAVAPGAGAGGPWTAEEHERFLRGLATFGTPSGFAWNRIASVFVRTRSSGEVRKHWMEYVADWHDPDHPNAGLGADDGLSGDAYMLSMDGERAPPPRWIRSLNCSADPGGRLPEGWCLDDDRVPRYTRGQDGAARRVVRHYTHDGYERCLANKVVVFVGDSRVRYQFNHLANFLASKKQMRCRDSFETLDETASPPDEECSLIDNDHGAKMDRFSWNEWYKQSTAMLARRDEQESLCDCFRPVPFKKEDTYENRFVRRPTPYGTVNLVYLQNFVNLVRIGRDFPPFAPFGSSERPSARCAPGACDEGHRTNAFSGDLNETLWTVLPLLNATHAFVSLGWGSREGRFSCAIQEFEARHPRTRVEFITHPPPARGPPRGVGRVRPQRLDCPGVGVLNRWDMAQDVPKSWYFDSLHVLGILNEAFNHELLERICPLDTLEDY